VVVVVDGEVAVAEAVDAQGGEGHLAAVVVPADVVVLVEVEGHLVVVVALVEGEGDLVVAHPVEVVSLVVGVGASCFCMFSFNQHKNPIIKSFEEEG
jgi:hypothetical protein